MTMTITATSSSNSSMPSPSTSKSSLSISPFSANRCNKRNRSTMRCNNDVRWRSGANSRTDDMNSPACTTSHHFNHDGDEFLQQLVRPRKIMRRDRLTRSTTTRRTASWLMMLLLASLCAVLRTPMLVSFANGFEVYSTQDNTWVLDEDEILQFYQSQVMGDSSSTTAVSNVISHKKDSENESGENDSNGNNGEKNQDTIEGKQKLQFGSVMQSSYTHGKTSSSASAFADGGSFASTGEAGSSSTSQTSGGSSQTSNSVSCPPTTCASISTYDILPLYPNCKEYILCQNYQLTLKFSCGEGLLFDNARKRCAAKERVDCACVTSETTSNNQGTSAEEGTSAAESSNNGGTMAESGIAGDTPAPSAAAVLDTTTPFPTWSPTSMTPFPAYLPTTKQPASSINTQGGLETSGGMSVTSDLSLKSQTTTEQELATICTSKSSELLPLLTTNCREYVNCVNGRMVHHQPCPEGMKFDIGIKGCNWKDLVECGRNGAMDGGNGTGGNGWWSSGNNNNGPSPPPTWWSASANNNEPPAWSPANNEPSGPSSPSGFVNVGNLGFGNDNDDDFSFGNDDTILIIEPEPEDTTFISTTNSGLGDDFPLNLAEEELEIVCDGQGNALLPLETTGCRYFVNCANDIIYGEVQQCAANTLFDIATNGCNWDSMVDCPTMSPTKRPTKSPTREPTKRPTRRPSPGPTLNPIRNPTPPPSTPPPTPGPTNRPVVRPTPPPTPFPTKRPTTMAPFSAPPDVFDWLQDHQRSLNQEVFKAYTQDGTGYRSYWFQYQDFYSALQLVSNELGSGSVTGLDKHIFYTGESPEDWEYGLVNIAAFLAHAMTESIGTDACDEFHWEQNSDQSASCDKTNDNKCYDNHYAISNACGQHGQNYQDFVCSAEEEHMQCEPDRNLILQATTSSVYPNAPPPLSCRPRSTGESYTGYWDVPTGKELSLFPYENTYGRTDVEGCCYWGRGALHTKGVCNIGKINYYLGKKAADEGRKSRYPSTDFCQFPEAICAAPESREMRWVTSMFDWMERVQSYDDTIGWNYVRKLKDFVDGGLVDFEFLESTSGILNKGCHDPPCVGSGPKISGGYGAGLVHLAEERVTNFQQILIALEAGGEEALLRALIKYFTDRQDIMNSEILRSQTPQGQLYPSYRYQLADFLSALTYISETGVGGRKFYIGEARVPEGVRYGIVNAIMFLSQGYKESIQYDACDENNWQLVNDRFPLSNACGQLDMSYQDMHCREDEAFMECPVKAEMEQVALTSAGWFQAPAPFKCGPTSKFPTTGFWDYDLGRENNGDAYANAKGRVDVEGCCWWGRGVIQTRGTCNYGKLNYFMGKRAADEGRDALYPKIDFCEFPQGVCSSDETHGGELQWMVGFFEWTDRVQTYDVDGWNYIEKLKEFTDGGYTDFSFVDHVSGILNIGCHDPPCKGYSEKEVDPHNKQDRNDTFQRFLNQLQVARNFRPPPKPTPMPSPAPTDEPTVGLPTTPMPTILDEPTETPTITSMPTALQGRPPDSAVNEHEDKITASKARFAELLLVSLHPSGELWPSYLYTWEGFQLALKKMTTGVGPGEKNFFYIGDGYSEKSLEYGLVNTAAFVAQGITQSIYYDACDENNWDMVDFRYPLANSCGQQSESYQNEVCEGDDEGMECPVDPKMEVRGVTHARWVGAPPPMYCGDRNVGYWDHITGLEEHEPPFKNRKGRSDIKGCCWWGRGVLQVRGVCSYGKLNHWLGAKAAEEGRPSIYPDIDFCKDPGVICSDKRAPELRWITGMFHWAQTIQRSREYNYFPILKAFVDAGDYKDGSFIGMVNTMLGGSPDDISRRTKTFFNALRAFNLISVETNSTGTPEFTFCGVDFNDAGTKCTPCETNIDCTGLELCHADVIRCDPSIAGVDATGSIEGVAGSNGTNATANTFTADSIEGANTTDPAADEPPAMTEMTMPITSTTNYCGGSWGDAATNCVSACPSGTDMECAPEQYCFGDITTCSNNNIAAVGNNNHNAEMTSNYCGLDWSDAHSKCSSTCPGGSDAECPPTHSCFGDIHC